MISSFFQKIIPTYLWDFLRNPRSCAEELHKRKPTKKGTDFSIPSALNQLNTKSLLLKPR